MALFDRLVPGTKRPFGATLLVHRRDRDTVDREYHGWYILFYRCITKEEIMADGKLLSGVVEEYEKLTEDELTNLGIVLNAYRSFRGDRRAHIAYVSMPITSGRRYYNTLRAHGVKSVEELVAKEGKDALWLQVIKPNLDEGVALADSLGLEHNLLFIAPSVFEAKKWRWSQEAYMSLWYRVIGEMAGSHYVMDGWEYSTGGLKEVMFSMFMQWRYIRSYNLRQAARIFGLQNFLTGLTPEQERREIRAMWGIRVYDQRGKELRIDDVLAMAVAAIDDLRNQGLPYDGLLAPACSIKGTPLLSPLPVQGSEKYGVPSPTDRFWKARERVEQISREQHAAHPQSA